MRTVFMGSAEFGIPALNALGRSHQVVGVVSTPPRPRGRGLALADSPIAAYAKKRGLEPLLTPESLSDESFIDSLHSFDADIFVVVAFKILPESVFSLPRLGTVNIHASLLPRYRGPAPIQRAIEAGERETGVTIFKIDAGVDTGKILTQRSVAIGPRETTPELYERLSGLGAEALGEALEDLGRGEVRLYAQSEVEATRAPKLRKEEARIDWSQPSGRLFNRIRAFKPFPGAYAMAFGKRLGVDWAEPAHEGAGAPGAVTAVGGETVDVACGEGLLRLVAVKPEGRKTMPAGAWARGARITKGMRLE